MMTHIWGNDQTDLRVTTTKNRILSNGSNGDKKMKWPPQIVNGGIHSITVKI